VILANIIDRLAGKLFSADSCENECMMSQKIIRKSACDLMSGHSLHGAMYVFADFSTSLPKILCVCEHGSPRGIWEPLCGPVHVNKDRMNF
jgi:hypothetical protein